MKELPDLIFDGFALVDLMELEIRLLGTHLASLQHQFQVPFVPLSLYIEFLKSV